MNENEIFALAMEIETYSSLMLKYFNDAVETRLEKHGERINSLQYGYMRMLQFEPLTISEISRRMGLDPSSLVRSIDVLERKGLVERGVDPSDRRRNPVHLSQKGLELMKAVPRIAENDLSFQALQSLGMEKNIQLRNLLQEFVQSFPEGKMVVESFSTRP